MKLSDQIQQGMHFLAKVGHHEAAQWMLEKALSDFPENAGWHYERAILVRQMNDNAEALEHFRRAAELEPGNALYQKSFGDVLHVDGGQIDQALEQYRKVLAIDPHDLETLLTAAHLSVARRDFDQACAYYERAQALDPNRTEASQMLEQIRTRITKPAGLVDPLELYHSARIAVDKGDFPSAKDLLRQILKSDPNSAQAHNDLAVLVYEEGDKDTAIHHYAEAVRLEPDNSVYLKNLADFLYIERGDVQSALQKYIQVLTQDPLDCEALLASGHICLNLGQKEDANVFFNRVLEIEPWNENARQLLNGANAFVTPSFDACSGEDLYAHAREAIVNGNRDLAMENLKQLISQFPDHALAYNDMGVLSYEEGDKNAALGFYEQASRLEPDNPIFLKNLADYYYVELGRIEDALSLYVKILEKDNEDIECLIAAGTICTHIGKDDDARVFFNRVLEIEPWNQESANALNDLDQKKNPSCFTTDPRTAVQ